MPDDPEDLVGLDHANQSPGQQVQVVTRLLQHCGMEKVSVLMKQCWREKKKKSCWGGGGWTLIEVSMINHCWPHWLGLLLHMGMDTWWDACTLH